ncbi:Na(+)-translocating NADH-quinone reductase subunit C [Calycomorphotria hydatis]|uniref:Na(+)-translocating NADH-quinone reductase subunit C n=1 Tax=Calycomorphotria hydatis TaxID=2528027 RepID=A0A517TEP3_9PLAN|nr:Na(+)-translocating NADH-quinone reductase subunit C [Calycomorphotria hydatis]QDT66842.1 Na(+)-translocating NADH-quinone reductase subunit C [Calycomorphotria hydatis]
MSRDSIGNILKVATSLCLICSLLVSAAAIGLRSFQETNKLRDKQKNVLMAAGKATSETTSAEVEKLFGEEVTPLQIDLDTGDFYTKDSEKYVADYDQRSAEKKPEDMEEIPADIRREYSYGIASRVKRAEVYVIGDVDSPELIVLPIRGKGLWSTLYGFLALELKKDPAGEEPYVIKGITYYEHAETPGLGGEVDNPKWKAQWEGKIPYEETADGELKPQISVSKAVVGPQDAHIDAIAGATITSNGVQSMVNFWLSDDGFGKYLEKLSGADKAAQAKRSTEKLLR